MTYAKDRQIGVGSVCPSKSPKKLTLPGCRDVSGTWKTKLWIIKMICPKMFHAKFSPLLPPSICVSRLSQDLLLVLRPWALTHQTSVLIFDQKLSSPACHRAALPIQHWGLPPDIVTTVTTVNMSYANMLWTYVVKVVVECFFFFHICDLNLSPLLTYVVHDNGILYENSMGKSSCCWEQFCSWIFPMTGSPKILTLSQHEPIGINKLPLFKKKSPQKEKEKTGTGIFIMSSSVFGGTSTTRFRDLVKGHGKDHGKRKVVRVYRPTQGIFFEITWENEMK